MTILMPTIPMSSFKAPKDYASLKNIGGKDWANDIESVIVGSNATSRFWR